MGSVMVVDGLELRVSRAAGRGHRDTVFLTPIAADLSYLHLSRLIWSCVAWRSYASFAVVHVFGRTYGNHG